MSRLRLTISMSLDGYVAGPHQSVKEPLGVGGEALHEWVFPLAAWREPHGMKGGEVNESTPVVEHTLTNIAVIEKFLPVEITVDSLSPKRFRISVSK